MTAKAAAPKDTHPPLHGGGPHAEAAVEFRKAVAGLEGHPYQALATNGLTLALSDPDPRVRGTALDRISQLIQSGGNDAGLPHRHVPAVRDDRDGVEQDADEGEGETRVLPIRP